MNTTYYRWKWKYNATKQINQKSSLISSCLSSLNFARFPDTCFSKEIYGQLFDMFIYKRIIDWSKCLKKKVHKSCIYLIRL